MQLMIAITKKYWAFFLLAFAIVFFIYKTTAKANVVFKPSIYNVNGGFGYKIFVKDSLIITQENIPGISGSKPFATKADAEKCATLVIEKLQKIDNNFPSVTIEEIEKLGIKY